MTRVKTSISMGYMSPNPRVINLHITSYIQHPEPLSNQTSTLKFGYLPGSQVGTGDLDHF